MTLGKKIRYLRETANMLQSDLAQRLRITSSTISKYESDALEPNLGIIKELMLIFNVSADYLIDDDYNQPVCLPRLSIEEIDLINKFRAGEEYTLDEKELAVIKLYRELPPIEKGEMRGLMQGLTYKIKQQPLQAENP